MNKDGSRRRLNQNPKNKDSYGLELDSVSGGPLDQDLIVMLQLAASEPANEENYVVKQQKKSRI
jgi:hypothetical protein